MASLHFCRICPRRGECSESAAETLHSPPLGRMDRLGLYLLSNRALPRACLCVVAAAQLQSKMTLILVSSNRENELPRMEMLLFFFLCPGTQILPNSDSRSPECEESDLTNRQSRTCRVANYSRILL